MEAVVMHDTFIDNAKVMAKGQVTIPKDVRNVLGITNGSRVTFVVEQGTVRLVNSATYAMQMMQREMAEEGTTLSEDDVMALVKDVRRETIGEDSSIAISAPPAATGTPFAPYLLRSPSDCRPRR